MSLSGMIDNYERWTHELNVADDRKRLVDVLVDFWQLVKDEQGYVIGRLVGKYKNDELDVNG